MGLVGELAQARNQLLHHLAKQEVGALHTTARDLDDLTKSLYQAVEKTRTQRIGVLFEELTSLIAELGYRFSKRLCVLIEGDATEVDNTLLQAIGRPLAHLLRNLVIHGIEPPEVRRAAGKAPEGTISLRASREGTVLYLEISDDGSGLDSESIRQKTVALGLVSRERAIQMTDSEAITILLGSGIGGSSAADTPDRCVGTNAVAALFDQFGGTVELQSRTGRGTTVRLRIPLSLTIMPALLVTACGERYAFPQPCLRGLVRLDRDQADRDIGLFHNTPVYRHEGRILPLIRLDQELGLAPQRNIESANIVVLRTDDTSFGVLVDEVLDFEELVVKPLGRPLNDIGVFAGASAMPDGTTTLVLDPRGLANKSGVTHGEHPRPALDTGRESARRQESLLLFSSSAGGRFAISLSHVIRLQKIKKATIERTGHRDVVQYDDEILPLISLEGLIDGFSYGTPSKDTIVVAVYRRRGPSVGLIVDHLLDIVDVAITVERPTHVDALLGSVVVHGHVTDLIDVDYIVRSQDPLAFRTAGAP